ncbi:phospholipid-translocating P-type ATPase [Guyanagaster necrorhizus]|uniref:Phospholipid-transporting ATPase n=1 Tax=Guyanagaster necrorhizus TaxID=856835 RepID=A0A9P7VXN7_9AGAR|nr:phospholipid-translocating P-type ATPase [Guyanagaster necrorhizus MCA 3950]KAG7448365.1 phospholipid-translocating P-type ATPase [Guyanagaster necrorhizus MCA 3950]
MLKRGMFSGLAAWYEKVAAFNIETLFVKKKTPGPKRTVFVNESLPEDYYDKKGRIKGEHVYASNQVITSKYNVVTFLPRNLLEQFRRVANVFFLGIAILQFFPKFSTISPGLVILPLLIVLGITAIKDAYEDIKRHQSDGRVNRGTVRVLAGGDWHNANITGNKTRDFTHHVNRFLIPEKFRKTAPPTPLAEKVEGKEGLESSTPVSPVLPPPDIEFDDGTDHPRHRLHLFGHQTYNNPHWKKALWEDVCVGDFVKILDNEPLPADILICATSEDENVAFVETKNLDGETNLKSRNAVPSLTHLRTAKACTESKFAVNLDRPDNNMFRLNSTISADGEQAPADIQMTLLRGTVLRNTGWVIGLVIFTGEDTKIIQNSGGTPSKRSKVERQMNPQVFINLIILACMAIACAIADSVLEHQMYPEGAPWLYDDNRGGDNPSINGLVTWAFALITFQNIVPISLYISIEFVRTCQAAFIYFDYEIWYPKTNQPTLARTWNLSDDLGQIEYIFSDKTGTLTQNSMIFRQCSIGGKVYVGQVYAGDIHEATPPASQAAISADDHAAGASAEGSSATITEPTPGTEMTAETHFHCESLERDIAAALQSSSTSGNAAHARALNGFFSVLALCHTVLTSINPETRKIEYKAQSPDEAALVRAAADLGYVFRGRDREILTLQTPLSTGPDDVERYELLNILEFTSARKRMSVVLRKLDDADGRLFLLMKGADNVVFERLRKSGDESLRELTETHLSEFANGGLRTLTLAYKVINEDEYAAWSERYHEATVALDNREARIEMVSDELEHDLRLLGATAIEDSLQDGVPETIADLKRAGIKVWVATGDKLETAIAIGHSTNLIGRESNIIVIRGGNHHSRPVYQQMVHAVEEFFPESGILDEGESFVKEQQLASVSSRDDNALRRVETGISSIVGANNGDRPGGFVLVIDGTALDYALGDEEHKNLLLRLAMLCEGVICCRVSPLQKALIVRLVKDGLGAMTLAIGDGANDVSMIQAADVGVGISGEEGLQAVNSSDYAIAQFRFLKRLLFVHGHWSYARNGNMILNFFYKNIVCIGVLWWFQIYCGWSSNYVFEYTYLLFWNSFWTLAPVIAIGIFDRLIDADVLMAIPELYRYGREGKWFGLKWFTVYMFDGVYQSAIIFFIILYGYFSPTSRTDGYDQHLQEFSTTMVFSAVIVANLFNGLNTNVWTGWVFFAVFIGIILLWLYTVVYNAISPGWFVTLVYGNNTFLFRSALFWLALPITVCVSLAPRYIAKAWKFGFAPDDIDILRYIRKIDPGRDLYSVHQEDGIGLKAMKRPLEGDDALSRRTSRSSYASMTAGPSRPGVHSGADIRLASRTDMSTGIRSVHRGFDFATEEGGVAMSRMQSHLSERRTSSRNLTEFSRTASRHKSGKKSADGKRSSDGPHHGFSIRRGLRKLRPGTSGSENPS